MYWATGPTYLHMFLFQKSTDLLDKEKKLKEARERWGLGIWSGHTYELEIHVVVYNWALFQIQLDTTIILIYKAVYLKMILEV